MGDKAQAVHARALQRAADILGGKEPLRAALRVPMVRLDEWLAGHSEPPMDIFLRAVDIISAPAMSTPQAAAAAGRARTHIHPAAAKKSRQPRDAHRGMAGPADSIKRFLAGSFELQERMSMLASALDAAIEATHAQMGNVQLKSERGLEIVTYRGFDEPFLKFFACVTDHRGAACGAAMQSGARVIVTDVASDPIFVGTEAARIMESANARACQSTPLVSGSGQFFGMLNTHFDHPHQPANEELALVDQIVERAAFWLEEAKG